MAPFCNFLLFRNNKVGRASYMPPVHPSRAKNPYHLYILINHCKTTVNLLNHIFCENWWRPPLPDPPTTHLTPTLTRTRTRTRWTRCTTVNLSNHIFCESWWRPPSPDPPTTHLTPTLTRTRWTTFNLSNHIFCEITWLTNHLRDGQGGRGSPELQKFSKKNYNSCSVCEYVITSLGGLKEYKDFNDVTLVHEDDK